MKLAALIAVLLIGCESVVQNQDKVTKIYLQKVNDLYVDTSGIESSLQYRAYFDSSYTSDSFSVAISPTRDTVLFTFKSFSDDMNFRSFDIASYSLMNFRDYTLIYLNATYHLNDVIRILPEARKYSFNVYCAFESPLPQGKYVFVANVGEYWFKGNAVYHLQGSFKVY